MWYYSFENVQIGPVDEESIRTLISEQKIYTGTLVWKQGMVNWQPAGATPLAVFFDSGATFPAAIQPMVYRQALKAPDTEIKELNDLFMWYWICLIGIVFTFGLSAIASAVLFYIILYRSWKLIQDGYARTTPGKAVGFLFIPFYNFYWIFQALPGLTRDTNAYIQRHALPIVTQDESVPTSYCILSLLSMVPYLNFLTGIGAFIMQIIMLKNFKDISIAIVRARK
ncbi:MAG: hypothetical protein FD147_1907 [Chloroflexi bacterium]|nr:MAG: hypothetical protein FD147_1907 [Chloroflexota bacterium]MBA4374819.1 hypothetical protein [Anaerolinea sp.]